MTFGNYYNINNSQPYQTNFKSGNETVVTGPISAVQKGVENSIDTFVTKVEKNKKKKSTKAAIAAGSTVLVLSALVMLLNPRHSTKTMQRLKIWEEQAKIKMKNNKNDYLKSKFHKGCTKFLNGTQSLFTLVSNGNSLKDTGFKYLCCEKKKNITHNNKTIENIYKKIDNCFTTIFNKPHEKITSFFDNISQESVRSRYKNATKSMNNLEVLINEYSKDLPLDKQNQIKSKLSEITKSREYFSDINLTKRFNEQSYLMKDLEKDLKNKWRNYTNGYGKDVRRNSTHFVSNLTFWVEDILAPQKKQVEEKGAKAVEKLIGNGKDATGSYNEIINILKNEIDTTKSKNLEKSFKSVSSNLKKANHSECFEYFDKKRDLVLGSAPTDIVTTIIGHGGAGIAIGKAENKENRISKTITVGIPAILGLGTNLVCAAAMLSGPVGILTSLGVSFVANRIASAFDKHVLGHADEDVEESKKNNKQTEVVNA